MNIMKHSGASAGDRTNAVGLPYCVMLVRVKRSLLVVVVKFLLPQGRRFYSQFSLLLFADTVFITTLGCVNHTRHRSVACYDCQWLEVYYYWAINRFYILLKCFINSFNSFNKQYYYYLIQSDKYKVVFQKF